MDRITTDLPGRLLKLLSFNDSAGIVKGIASVLGIVAGYVFDGDAARSAAIGVCILVILDTVTGFWAAVVQGVPRTSAKIARVLSKVFGYAAVTGVAAVSANTIAKGLNTPIVTGVLWLIIATEGLSILENAEKMGLAHFGFLRSILGKVIQDDNDGTPTHPAQN